MSSSSDVGLQINQLPFSIQFPQEDDEFFPHLTLWARQVADAVNTKTAGLYTLQEKFNGNQFFTTNNPNIFRNVYREVFDMVALNGGNIAGGATASFPHNISGLFQTALIYASCTSTDPKYFSVMGPNSAWLNATNVNFTNPTASPLTQCVVIAEYLKN